MPVTVPDRSPSSLGPALSNTRAPTTNELSAVHVEEIKDVLIDLANAVNAPELEVATFEDAAITVTGLDGVYGPLEIRPFGLSGVTDIAITPTIVPSGPGKAVTVLAGQGALHEDGGVLSLDAGQGNGTGDGGNVRIGRENAEEVLIGKEGGGATITLEGTVDVLGTIEATGEIVSAPLAPIEETLTARTLSASDHGRTISFTNASGCTVTVPDTLPVGFTALLVQYHASGAVTVVGPSVSLQVAAAFEQSPPTTAEQYSAIAVVVVYFDEVLVTGDLLPA